jgi:hypothetical protein
MITYELPTHVFYYWVIWENYYQEFTWEQMDNNWNI